MVVDHPFLTFVAPPPPPRLCPATAGLFRMVGYAGKTMVLANSFAMLLLLLMIITNGGLRLPPPTPLLCLPAAPPEPL